MPRTDAQQGKTGAGQRSQERLLQENEMEEHPTNVRILRFQDTEMRRYSKKSNTSWRGLGWTSVKYLEGQTSGKQKGVYQQHRKKRISGKEKQRQCRCRGLQGGAQINRHHPSPSPDSPSSWQLTAVSFWDLPQPQGAASPASFPGLAPVRCPVPVVVQSPIPSQFGAPLQGDPSTEHLGPAPPTPSGAVPDSLPEKHRAQISASEAATWRLP